MKAVEFSGLPSQGKMRVGFRLAAYAVCIESGAVLRQVSNTWSLPGGKVEHGEDPIDAVIRKLVRKQAMTQ
jgi:8-oxo-dGTP diphosphatase